MISLLSPLQFETKDGNSALILWLCDPFDVHYSFRTALAELEQGLSTGTELASHDLPEEWPEEDFVDGLFRWGTRQFGLYYERSLGYMQFSSELSTDVRALHAALLPITRVKEQQTA